MDLLAIHPMTAGKPPQLEPPLPSEDGRDLLMAYFVTPSIDTSPHLPIPKNTINTGPFFSLPCLYTEISPQNLSLDGFPSHFDRHYSANPLETTISRVFLNIKFSEGHLLTG